MRGLFLELLIRSAFYGSFGCDVMMSGRKASENETAVNNEKETETGIYRFVLRCRNLPGNGIDGNGTETAMHEA